MPTVTFILMHALRMCIELDSGWLLVIYPNYKGCLPGDIRGATSKHTYLFCNRGSSHLEKLKELSYPQLPSNCLSIFFECVSTTSFGHFSWIHIFAVNLTLMFTISFLVLSNAKTQLQKKNCL